MDRVPLLVDGEREEREAFLRDAEVRQNDDGTFTVAGYAAVFNSASEDLGGWVEEIKPGAFRKVLRTDPDVRFLVNHDGIPLARSKSGSLKLSEDPRGLKIEADLSDTQTTRDLVASLDRGDMDQMSFMFRVNPEGREWFFPDDPEELARRVIYEIAELFDVSAVTFPAYRDTNIGLRAVIAGQPIVDADGLLDRGRFDDVCQRIMLGRLDATELELRHLTRAAERLDTATPWQRTKRTDRGADEQPDRVGDADTASDGERASDDAELGKVFGLAVRRRRLSLLEADIAASGTIHNH